jgi:hypothetical protein
MILRVEFVAFVQQQRDAAVRYSDAKVANRNAKVWHGATENGS